MSQKDVFYITKKYLICHKETKYLSQRDVFYRDVLYIEAEIYHMSQRDLVFVAKRRNI